MDFLRSSGAADADAYRTVATVGSFLPMDRPVVVTNEVAGAARAGDIALVRTLLAEEVDAEPGELDIIEAARREDDGTRYSAEQTRAEIGV